MLSVVLAVLCSTPVADRPKVFALVIGNNRSHDERVTDLKFADDDAIAMHELLVEAGVRSVLLVNADAETRALSPLSSTLSPTPATVRATWDQLQSEMAAERGPVEFIFFFSGHGDITHGEGSLVLEGGRLTRTVLQSMLAGSAAGRNHVVIDACKSYFAVLGKGPGGRREPYTEPFASSGGALNRSGFLLSTSSDGDSHEWDRFQAGVFSFEVRSALRGSADANLDGVITYRELGGFLHRANAAIANAQFRPDFLVVPPSGSTSGLDEPVLRWPAQSAALELDGAPTHLYVEAPSGRRILEINRAPELKVALRLPAVRPLYLRSADEKDERVLVANEFTSLQALARVEPSVSRKGALHQAFTLLFAQPFDASAAETFTVAPMVSAEVRAEASPRELVRTTALIAGGVATTVALGSLVVGIERTSISPTTSNLERLERNRSLGAVNATLFIAGGVAVAAFSTWLIATLVTPPKTPVSVGVGPGSVTLGVEW
ncbi:MAG: caspase family protein [Archangium sp.]